MNTEQERADFEAWAKGHYILQRSAYNDTYIAIPTMRAWEAWQARAALQSQDRDCVAALHKALQALEAIADEMTVGDRFTNAGQYLLDALEPVREAIDHARRIEGESHEL